MYLKNKMAYLFLLGVFFIFTNSPVSAQEMMEKKETNVDKPTVAIIYASWCGYCREVDPVISDLKTDYSERINFIVFDVSDKQTIAASKEKAKSLGLEEFFNKNKEKTSTVAVLVDKDVVYKTSNNRNRSEYVTAFDEALQ